MKYLLTICSNDKNPAEGMLPARERYVSDFMNRVIEEGERTETPVLILPGKFGLLNPDTEIPYYDYFLTADKVDSKVPAMAEQLRKLEADQITAYLKKPRTTPNWEAYYALIEKSAAAVGAELEFAHF